MGKLYNFVMVGCTTLLEKFSKRPVDLEMHLLGGGKLRLAGRAEVEVLAKSTAASWPVAESCQQRIGQPCVQNVESADCRRRPVQPPIGALRPSSRSDCERIQQWGDRDDRPPPTMAWLTRVSRPPNSPVGGAPPTGLGGGATGLRSVVVRPRAGRRPAEPRHTRDIRRPRHLRRREPRWGHRTRRGLPTRGTRPCRHRSIPG
jgi:hypothetical protein